MILVCSFCGTRYRRGEFGPRRCPACHELPEKPEDYFQRFADWQRAYRETLWDGCSLALRQYMIRDTVFMMSGLNFEETPPREDWDSSCEAPSSLLLDLFNVDRVSPSDHDLEVLITSVRYAIPFWTVCGNCGEHYRVDHPMDNCPYCDTPYAEGLIMMVRKHYTPDTVIIRGVKVDVIQLNPEKWLAGWNGSDGKEVAIMRHTREAVIADVPTIMDLRAKVFHVKF